MKKQTKLYCVSIMKTQKKMDDLQEFNNKLIKSCKKANRDFFILVAAYVATLMLMIYLFIR